MAAVMFIVVTVVFLIVRVTPGDPAAVMLGPDATAAEVAALREQPRAQPADPRPVRRSISARCCAAISASRSSSTSPCCSAIAERAEPTLFLTLFAMLIAASIAVPIGILAAYRRGSAFDQVVATAGDDERQHPELLAGPGGAADDRREARPPAGGRLRAARRRLPRAHAAPDPAGRWSWASSARR